MFRPITCVVLLIIGCSVYNTLELLDEWSNDSFFSGLVCGLPLVTLYMANFRIKRLFAALGILGLIVIAIGGLDGLERDRLYFVGLSIGTLFGWIPAFFLVRKRVSEVLFQVCQKEGYKKITLFFELEARKIKDE